jgi:hypothetical protein
MFELGALLTNPPCLGESVTMLVYSNIVGGLAFACVLLGFVLDHFEYKHGYPSRLPVRYEFLGILAAIPLMILAIVLASLANAPVSVLFSR